MLSIWEKEALLQYDFIVVGAGIVGLSTALSLRERHPHASILVLERGILPTGASTKNAGFACIGTVGEKIADISAMGEDNMVQLMIKRWEGLQLLRKRVTDEKMDFEQLGGYELILKNRPFDMGGIERMNQLLKPWFNKPLYSQQQHLIKEFGFSSDKVETIIMNRVDGQLHSGKMIKKLWSLCNESDINILTGAEVISIHDSSQQVHVTIQNGQQQPVEAMSFAASRVAVCTNAFTRKLFPDLQLTPGRGQILLTFPIPNLPFKGTFNFDDGFYYFRNLNNRVLFGGGRNLDFGKETSTEMQITAHVQKQLEIYLANIILPQQTFTITDRWAGIMAFSKEKMPEVRSYSERVFIGIKMNGMGVALGSKVGEELATLMTD